MDTDILNIDMADKIELWEVEKLTPYDKNARTHSEDQVRKIASSMSQFGFTNPILVDSNTGIIAGHGRLQAAKLLGLKKVPVIILDHLNEQQKRAYILADNRLALDAGWDTALLHEELKWLDDQEFDLELTGFSEEELSAILDPTIVEPEEEPDVSNMLPKEAKTKPGDIYILGNHRLMCGNSTMIDQVESLMNGQKASACFTSPPYNGDTHLDYGKGNNKKLYNNDFDAKTSDEYIAFCHEVLANIFIVTEGFIFWNVNYNAKSRFEYIKCIYPFIDHLWETIAWKKTGMPISSGLTRCFEFIFCFRSPNGKKKHLGNPNETEFNLWDISNLNSQHSEHRACFPVALPSKGISLATEQSEIIFEPFGGSGTTLIAAHELQRRCYSMELDPKYCDLIVSRWCKYTGTKKIKLNDSEIEWNG